MSFKYTWTRLWCCSLSGSRLQVCSTTPGSPHPTPRYLMSFSVLRLIFVTYACTLAFQREVGPLLCEPGKTSVPQAALVCSCSLRTLHLDTHILWMILRKCELEILCIHNLIWKRNWAPQWQHKAFFSEDAAIPSTYFRLLRNKIVWFSPPKFRLLHVCLCSTFTPGAHEGERRALPSLERWLWACTCMLGTEPIRSCQ